MSGVTPVAVRRVAWILGAPETDLPLGSAQAGGAYAGALLVLEHDGVPWAVVAVAAADGVVAGAAIAAAAQRYAGAPWTPETRDDGEPGPLRVVVTTDGDAWRVIRAVGALLAAPDPLLEIVIMAPAGDAAGLDRALGETFPGDARVSVREAPRPGRAAARNAGAVDLGAGLVAFVGDDIVVHPYWATALRLGMHDAGSDGIAVGIGRVLPLAIETERQWVRFRSSTAGRHPEALGRLDRPAIWTAGGVHAAEAAAEGGLCMPAAVFASVGGFDVRLGPGTPSGGGDELDLVLRATRAGAAARDIPRAVLFRELSDGSPRLEGEAFARGIAVSATMTKQLTDGAGGAGRIGGASSVLRVGHVARVRRYPDVVLEHGSARRLLLIERLGLLAGPVAYMRSAAAGRSRPR